ncbi:hypothetical protein [Paenibacillus alvei]|uniref:hypothetical protein n=1 Tax=Paenibacillus alvei TaxID=44250 RepID=UPI0018CD44B6|nr:hypothetical protein [Paenibacillus alvei]MBG9737105.1 hypothetical protein [Paenibacillus alvei]MBG9742785.1 hypothetical protein [Paenibacillus alvei]MBG9746198.1 hypothetical protein [Paenibacillus alvei]MCY9579692.1 hypothetical protein [Paenibacillus alvei]MCY9586345.1 hypothetical protein [Paenibacillus alvei]
MDYRAFYDEVVNWISMANQAAAQYGMTSEQFWAWVADSSGALCKKYQENPLVKKQMMMLVEWLEEVYEKQKG